MKNLSLISLIVLFTACSPNRQAEVLLTAASGEKCQTMPSVTFRHTNAQPMDGAVVIDPTNRRQTIDGIGTSLTESSAFVLACLSEEERQEVLQALFGADGAAFSLARTQIGASDFSVEGFYSLCETPDDTLMTTFSLDRDKEGFPRSKYPQIQNEHYDLYHLIKEAYSASGLTSYSASGLTSDSASGLTSYSASGLRLVANTWTAPHWMKDNNAYYQDHEHGSRGGVLLEKYYPAYARYLVKYLEAWRAEGIDIWAITPVNEPQGNGGGWESMDFYPMPEANFIANHLGPQLSAAGFGNVDILGFDQNVFEAMPYAEAIYCNADAKKYTAGLAMHWYGGTKTVYPETLDSIHNMAPDKKLIHTEGCIDNLGCPAWPGVTDEEGFVESGWFNNDSFWWNQEATDWAYSTPFDNGNHPKYAAAHRYASFIIDGMNHWLTGFIDWNCVLDSIGGPNHVGNMAAAPVMVDYQPVAQGQPAVIYYTPAYYVLKQLSRTLRPGDVVLTCNLQPATCNLHLLATQSQDGHYTIQIENEAETSQTFPLYIGKYKADITAPANSLLTLTCNL